MEAKIDRAPLFVRSASIVPTAVPGQNTEEMTTSDLILNIFPETEKTASFTLYEDDGVSLQYKDNCCSKRTFTCNQTVDNQIVINISKREKLGGYQDCETNGKILFRVLVKEKPKFVKIDGIKQKFSFDKSRQILEISVPDNGTSFSMVISASR